MTSAVEMHPIQRQVLAMAARARSTPAIAGDAPPLPAHAAGRFRAAARHARRVLPGSLGELAWRELTAYADFGYRFGGNSLISRLAAEILAMPSGPADVATPTNRA